MNYGPRSSLLYLPVSWAVLAVLLHVLQQPGQLFFETLCGINLVAKILIAFESSGDISILAMQTLVLLMLGGQLLVTVRQTSGEKKYVLFTLFVVIALALTYSLRLFSGLFDRSLPHLLYPALSVVSSASLVHASAAARGRIVPRFSLLAIATGLFALLAQLALDVSHSVAAFSVSACILAAWCFGQRAAKYGWPIATTLGLGFIGYGIIHFFEPALYTESELSLTGLYLLGLITKSIVFLAVVVLVVAEQSEESRQDQLQIHRKSQQLLDEARSFDRLIEISGLAYFRDDLKGAIEKSVGEESMLGIDVENDLSERKAIFSNPEDYFRWRERVVSRGDRSTRTKEKFLDVDGNPRIVELHASSRSLNPLGEQPGVLECFYRDVTEEVSRGQAVAMISEIRDRITHCNSIQAALDTVAQGLAEEIQKNVALYFADPSAKRLVLTSTDYPLAARPVEWPSTIALLESDVERNPGPVEAVSKMAFEDSIETIWFGDGGEQATGDLEMPTAALLVVSPNQEDSSYFPFLQSELRRLLPHFALILYQQVLRELDSLWSAVHIEGPTLSKALGPSLRRICEDANASAILVLRRKSAIELEVVATVGDSKVQFELLAEALQEASEKGLEVFERNVISPETEIAVRSRPHPFNNDEILVVLARDLTADDVSPFSELDLIHLQMLTDMFGHVFALADATRVFRQLVGRLAHDLRAPLTAIRNKALILRRNYNPSLDIDERLKELQDEASELGVLVDQIEFYRRDAIVEDPRPTLLGKDLVGRCCQDLSGYFQKLGATLPSISERFEDLPPVLVPRIAARRIAQNLIMNMARYGVDFSDAQHPPEIDAVVKDHCVEIYFRDWGQGINPADAERIFEEGFRGASTGKASIPGSGIGLAVSRQLAEDVLDGGLELTRLGNPTEFIWWIPIEVVTN